MRYNRQSTSIKRFVIWQKEPTKTYRVNIVPRT